jgi:hypothetical protein
VTDCFGDHCTYPILLLFGVFPPRALGCVRTSIVALTGLREVLYEIRRRMRTRRVAAQ